MYREERFEVIFEHAYTSFQCFVEICHLPQMEVLNVQDKTWRKAFYVAVYVAEHYFGEDKQDAGMASL